MPVFLLLQYEKQQDRSVGQTATINAAFLTGKAHMGCENTGKGKKVNLNGMPKLPIIYLAKKNIGEVDKIHICKAESTVIRNQAPYSNFCPHLPSLEPVKYPTETTPRGCTMHKTEPMSDSIECLNHIFKETAQNNLNAES